MFKKLFILFFPFLSLFLVSAQSDSTIVQFDTAPLQLKEITENDLQAYRDDPKFDYEVIQSNIAWWDDFTTWLGNIFLKLFEWLFGMDQAVGMLAGFLRLIPYLLLAFLLYVLIRFFVNINARSIQHARRNESIVSLSEEEHIIKNEDIQLLIQKALAEKNYRLAVRYYYLHILKLMTDKEIIIWELQKTNDDYIQEIKKAELIAPFRKITHLYDYIWYGNFHIDQTVYQKLETNFSSLQKTLNNG